MNEAKPFVIELINKRVKYEEPCDGRLSSTVPREGRVKFPPLTRPTIFNPVVRNVINRSWMRMRSFHSAFIPKM